MVRNERNGENRSVRILSERMKLVVDAFQGEIGRRRSDLQGRVLALLARHLLSVGLLGGRCRLLRRDARRSPAKKDQPKNHSTKIDDAHHDSLMATVQVIGTVRGG